MQKSRPQKFSFKQTNERRTGKPSFKKVSSAQSSTQAQPVQKFPRRTPGRIPKVTFGRNVPKVTLGKDAKTVSSKTSWGKEASWYSEHLEQGDTYHTQVILPNLERIVAPAKGVSILEIGCGEGFFARAFAHRGASVLATDLSKELITLAKGKGGGPKYHVSPAEDLSWVKPHSADIVVAVLTLQNMEKIEPVMKEVARILKKGGRFVFVLNHPTFRIPKATHWGFDEATKTQYRRVDAYLSARKEKMDMHPGKKGSHSFTYSFHHSLQDYMKALRAGGLAITRLEEWISHKTSEKGLRSQAENTARKEFPLFMCVEAKMVS